MTDSRRRRRQQEAIPAVIRSYLGEGRALVTLPGREEQFEVGTDRTYAPGSEVLIARPLGMMGQAVIISGPPPAAAGASRVQPSVARVAPEPAAPEPAPACPPVPSGHVYIGLVRRLGNVEAWRYEDGAPVSLLDTRPLSGGTRFPVQDAFNNFHPPSIAGAGQIAASHPGTDVWAWWTPATQSYTRHFTSGTAWSAHGSVWQGAVYVASAGRVRWVQLAISDPPVTATELPTLVGSHRSNNNSLVPCSAGLLTPGSDGVWYVWQPGDGAWTALPGSVVLDAAQSGGSLRAGSQLADGRGCRLYLGAQWHRLSAVTAAGVETEIWPWDLPTATPTLGDAPILRLAPDGEAVVYPVSDAGTAYLYRAAVPTDPIDAGCTTPRHEVQPIGTGEMPEMMIPL